MSLLSSEERDVLRKKGIYVKEKCDVCGQAILTPSKYIRDGKDICVGCRDKSVADGTWWKGKVPVSRRANKIQEEVTMAKEAKTSKVKAEKVGGHYQPNSLRAVLFQLLEDEKKHTMKEVAQVVGKEATNPRGLVLAVKRDGEKTYKEWAITVTKDDVKMKLGKGAKPDPKPTSKPVAKASAPAAKGTPKAAAKPGKSTASPTGKGAKAPTKAEHAVLRGLRKVLTSGKNWTKNKLVEAMNTKYGFDQKTVLAAIAREVSLGGLEDTKGMLSLAT